MKIKFCIAALLASLSPAASWADDYEATGWRKDALDYILEDNSSIREGKWTQDISLWISRDNDGSSHDGFADYLCLELFDKGMPAGETVIIKIWSYQAMLAGDLKEIGRNECHRN